MASLKASLDFGKYVFSYICEIKSKVKWSDISITFFREDTHLH